MEWGGGTIVPGTKDIIIPAYTDMMLTVRGEPKLLPENIRTGTALQAVIGTYAGEIESVFGVKKYAKDTFTMSEDTYSYTVDLSHSLHEIPKLAFIYAGNFALPQNSSTYIIYGIIDNVFGVRNSYNYMLVKHGAYSSYANIDGNTDNATSNQPTSTKIVLGGTNYYRAGVKYTLITMA